ncbi:MAG TPA: hypothetical protein VF200_01130 [Woeseiaceae bacterium]
MPVWREQQTRGTLDERRASLLPDIELMRDQLASVDLSAFEQAFAGDDPERRLKFNACWKQPIARSAWLEARGEEIRQGASDETG